MTTVCLQTIGVNHWSIVGILLWINRYGPILASDLTCGIDRDNTKNEIGRLVNVWWIPNQSIIAIVFSPGIFKLGTVSNHLTLRINILRIKLNRKRLIDLKVEYFELVGVGGGDPNRNRADDKIDF